MPDQKVTNYKSVSKSAEWYTPRFIIDSVEKVLGRIDLDPASCDEAQRTVNARVYFTKEQNGLDFQWRGRVFLNPPYGRKQVQIWVKKLIHDWKEGHIDQAILLVNNATDTGWFQHLWGHSICFVAGRISFEHPTKEAYAPAHGSCFIYLGKNQERFSQVFSDLGPVFQFAGDGLRKFKPQRRN